MIGSSVCFRNSSSVAAASNEKVLQIAWDEAYNSLFMRKLISEASSIFIGLKKANVGRKELITASRQYRSIIRSYSQEAGLQDSEEGIKIQQLFGQIEFIWSFCEIVYLSPSSSSAVVSQLAEWIWTHNDDPVRACQEIVESGEKEYNPGFWPTMYSLVVQGKTTMARKLLLSHSASDTRAFEALADHLKSMPFYSASSSASSVEFRFRWDTWQKKLQTSLKEGLFSHIGEMELVARILCGDDDAFQKVQHVFDTWYEYMISKLLYTDPVVKLRDVVLAASKCRLLFQQDSETLMDRILIAAFEADSHQVLCEIQSVMDNLWFPAHLADLLFHAGSLKAVDVKQDKFSFNLRESLLQDFAVSLSSHHSLWSIAVLYLDHCHYGRQILELVLPRIAVQSEKKANKIIAMAEKRELHGVVQTVCRIMGRRAIDRRQWGTALGWAERAQDTPLANQVADQFLQNYVKNYSFSSVELLDSLGSAVFTSDRLAFVGKYREFHKLVLADDRKAAAASLVWMLSTELAPRYFWPVLITDALPLLESDDVLINTHGTYVLMRCVQELENHSPVPKDRKAIWHTAMTRNLAKALILDIDCQKREI